MCILAAMTGMKVNLGPGGRTTSGIAFDDEGSGPPLTLVHAGVADRRMWTDLAGSLTGRHRVIRHDVRGAGESLPPAGPWSHHTDLLDLLDELLVTRTHLVGASMGAGIAAEAALARPALIGSLVLLAPGGALLDGTPDSFRPIWDAEMAALNRGDVDAAVELNLRAWVDGSRRGPEAVDPDVRAFVGQMQREAFELPSWDADQAPEGELAPPAAGRAAELACPVLVVVGDADDPAIIETAERIAAQAPRARLVVVPGVGHMLSLEQPAWFENVLTGFLDEVASGAFGGRSDAVPASSASRPDEPTPAPA